jgi:hypothetical protein
VLVDPQGRCPKGDADPGPIRLDHVVERCLARGRLRRPAFHDRDDGGHTCAKGDPSFLGRRLFAPLRIESCGLLSGRDAAGFLCRCLSY